MSYPTLSVIVASSNRPTLSRTFESINSQTRDGDEVLVAITTDRPWGNKSRNQLLSAAEGDVALFMDDDDCYVDGALDLVRRAFVQDPDRLHLFCMRYWDGRVLGREQMLACGHVSTQMVTFPRGLIVRDRVSGAWYDDQYEGDWHFIEMAVQILGEPVWHSEVIALVRPHLAGS